MRDSGSIQWSMGIQFRFAKNIVPHAEIRRTLYRSMFGSNQIEDLLPGPDEVAKQLRGPNENFHYVDDEEEFTIIIADE